MCSSAGAIATQALHQEHASQHHRAGDDANHCIERIGNQHLPQAVIDDPESSDADKQAAQELLNEIKSKE